MMRPEDTEEPIIPQEIEIPAAGAARRQEPQALVPAKGPDPVGKLTVDAKQREYTRNARRYRRVFYATRLTAGLASGLLPFVVSNYATLATILSILIVVVVVIDSTLDPKSQAQLFSKASDLLAIARLKAEGQYEQYKEALDLILATETQKLERLVDLEALLKRVSEAGHK